MTTNNLCASHLEFVLSSGIILDEDMEFILLKYKKRDEIYTNVHRYSVLEKVLAALCATGALFFVKTKFIAVPIVISPFVVFAAREILSRYVKRRRLYNVEGLVGAMCKNLKLCRQIQEYLKLRDVSISSTNLYNPYTPVVEEFVQNACTEQVHVLSNLKNSILVLSTRTDLLKHYDYVKDLEFDEFSTERVTNIKDSLACFKKLYDIHILLGSHFLTCLVIALCTKADADYEILDNVVPKTMNLINTSCSKTSKQFHHVKYYYLQKNVVKHKPRPETSPFSKLHLATCSTMLRSAEILEKSSFILDKLEQINLQSSMEQQSLEECIADLKRNVYSYYESLDLLHSLYEISLNKPKPVPAIESKSLSIVDSNSTKVNDASLNSVEPEDDEEYELYIGPNDTFDDVGFSSYVDQDNMKFASLLSRELKQKLKMHARFVAARTKRGIVDEDTDIAEKGTCEVESSTTRLETEKDVIEMNSNVDLAPPVPPPLFTRHESTEPELTLYTTTGKSFLEMIVNASKMHGNVEDVFGDSGSDSGSGSYQ